eukprot:TRINITY_DN19905_c0_g1_i1.p1 TRINITY_DN19905_c0_g1~~TRINITY_DN19905_c0_g1_i1.p1  ORF type:complete len:180 (+),score=14.56 TRINITY_DN19905_c0_g1_i1:171-710(+)
MLLQKQRRRSNNPFRRYYTEAERQVLRVLLAKGTHVKAAFLDGCSGVANLFPFAPDYMKCDREVVLKGVERDGHLLQYASEGLRGDRAVVIRAVQNQANALQYASEALRGDVPTLLKAAGGRKSNSVLRHAAAKLLDNKDVHSYSRWWTLRFATPKQCGQRRVPLGRGGVASAGSTSGD